MNFLIVLGALAFLMLVAYRGYSVILFAPVAALGAVLLGSEPRAANVFQRLHGEDGRLSEKLLPGVHARRSVRQGDRAVGILQGDRLRGDRFARSGACDSVDRRGLRDPDLRRRIAVRRGIRGLSIRRRDV